MRLVSAIWNDCYPFHTLAGVTACVSAEIPEELQAGDVLIVHGGADISPSLYNRDVSGYTGATEVPSWRDSCEWALMQRAKELEIPIIGICRGAQMLCALVGGWLIQHVQNHSGSHMVVTNDGKRFKVNSIHHQMLYPFEVDHEVIAWCPEQLSPVHYDVNTDIKVPQEVEFVYFPQVKGFAVQWHPEMMAEDTEANKYVLGFIENKLKELQYAVV